MQEQVVDRDSLYAALLNRDIASAAFDVFWEEPTDPNDRFLKLDNFMLTPHIAGWTAESVRAEGALIAENLYRLNQGKVLLLTSITPLNTCESRCCQYPVVSPLYATTLWHVHK